VELGRVDAGWSSRRLLQTRGRAGGGGVGFRQSAVASGQGAVEVKIGQRIANPPSPLFLSAQGPSYGRISFTKREPSSCHGMVISAIACLVG
jgi:hypothetical protein